MRKHWKLALSLLATLLWLCFIYARSAQPASVSHAESSAFLAPLSKLFPFLTMRIVRKLAHFVEYAALGSLLWLDWRLLGRGRWFLPLAAGLVFAAADELLQTRIPGRSGELKDVLLDFSGVCAAFCAAALLNRMIRRRKERKRCEA